MISPVGASRSPSLVLTREDTKVDVTPPSEKEVQRAVQVPLRLGELFVPAAQSCETLVAVVAEQHAVLSEAEDGGLLEPAGFDPAGPRVSRAGTRALHR